MAAAAVATRVMYVRLYVGWLVCCECVSEAVSVASDRIRQQRRRLALCSVLRSAVCQLSLSLSLVESSPPRQPLPIASICFQRLTLLKPTQWSPTGL